MTTDINKARLSAMNLLARREHSQIELRRKLQQREFDLETIQTVLADLQSEGLQCDQRFTSDYIQMRANRGFGPLRILQELEQRGISPDLAQLEIEAIDDWLTRAHAVRLKKFGQSAASDYPEQMKQKGFLQYRGFDSSIINAVFKTVPELL